MLLVIKGGWKSSLDKTSSGSLDQFVARKVSLKAMNLFKWIEQCVINDEALDFVENAYVRKHSRNDLISVTKLVKYMELVLEKVEN